MRRLGRERSRRLIVCRWARRAIFDNAAYNSIMAFKHRSVVDSIPAYKQGKSAPKGANRRAFKLSSNENPYPPLPSVQKAIKDHALDCINRYPDMGGWKVVERLAKDYGVDSENVVLGCGSTEVITQLVNLLAGPGDEVVYPWRSFEAYPIIVSGSGAASVQISNRLDGGHDFDAMIAAINDKTRLIIVNNRITQRPCRYATTKLGA